MGDYSVQAGDSEEECRAKIEMWEAGHDLSKCSPLRSVVLLEVSM